MSLEQAESLWDMVAGLNAYPLLCQAFEHVKQVHQSQLSHKLQGLEPPGLDPQVRVSGPIFHFRQSSGGSRLYIKNPEPGNLFPSRIRLLYSGGADRTRNQGSSPPQRHR